MNTVDREQIRRFLELQYGTDKGTVWIGAGTKQNHAEVPFLWPEQVEEIVEYVATTNEAGHEVWYAAHLSYSKAPKPEGQGRAVKMSVKRRRLHFDIDRALTAEDAAKLTELQAWLVYSGTPGHVHAYIELNRSVDVATYHKFEDWLVTYFGSDTAVCRDNGLLRIPGTVNCKPGAGSVTWDGTVSEHRWIPEELAAHIGLDLSVVPQATAQVASSAPIVAAPVSQVPQAIQYVLDNPKLKRDGTWDRSAMLATIVNAAASAGLTIGQTLGIALSRPELMTKGENWIRTDVPRLWTKFGGDSLADEESRKQMQDEADTAALMGGQADAFAVTGNSPPVRAIARRATEMDVAKESHWLARGRIPKGAVTVLIGDEGIGKSLFWVWLVAAITTGSACPMFGIPARAPADVAIVTTEDDWSTTVLPRLRVAGVDLSRVICIAENSDGSGAPTFPDDMDQIPEMVALIVVDAWLDTVPGKVSMKDPQQARAALRPWKELATRTGITPLLLMHTNRVNSSSARDKYGISGEVRKIARMTLFAQLDDDGTLTVGPEKHNTTGAVKASMFKLDTRQFFAATEDSDGHIAYLTLTGDSDRTAREQITATFENGATDAQAKDCTTWLSDYMDDHLGLAAAKELQAAANLEGFTTYALRKARLALKMPKPEMRTDQDGKQGWWWIRPT